MTASATGSLTKSSRLWRWAAVLGIGLVIAALPHPPEIPAKSWNLLAIFLATVTGLTLQPIPGGGMVLLGVSATVLLGVQPIAPRSPATAIPSCGWCWPRSSCRAE